MQIPNVSIVRDWLLAGWGTSQSAAPAPALSAIVPPARMLQSWATSGTLGLISLFLKRYHEQVRIHVLRPQHTEPVARLLTEQFCLREPLCRNLGMKVDELLPFFRAQVEHVARQGLGIVALDPAGQVIGAITIEDHLAPFVPDPALLTGDLELIGRLLDELTLPRAYEPEAMGQVYYCGLAAVRPGEWGAPVFILMLAGYWRHLGSKGYLRGYAKVTNPALLKQLRKVERAVGLPLFETVGARSADELPAERFGALGDFKVTLVSWPMSWLPSSGFHQP